ncbi:MAG: hypothetical protein ACI84K_001453 [Pseudohongiellaceae bacterium]|jgi:hypothetical protein
MHRVTMQGRLNIYVKYLFSIEKLMKTAKTILYFFIFVSLEG